MTADIKKTISQLESRRLKAIEAAERLAAEVDELALEAEFDKDKAKRRDDLRAKAEAERRRLDDLCKALAQANARHEAERTAEMEAHHAERVEAAIALAKEVEAAGSEVERQIAELEKSNAAFEALRKRLYQALLDADLRAIGLWLIDKPTGVTLRDLVIHSAPKVARLLQITRPAGYREGRMGALTKLRASDYDKWRLPPPLRRKVG